MLISSIFFSFSGLTLANRPVIVDNLFLFPTFIMTSSLLIIDYFLFATIECGVKKQF